jgi:negative regulator of sigma E activity
MNQSSLDRLLQQRWKQAEGTLPGSFSQNVWREIRQRKADEEPSTIAVSFWHWLLQPPAVAAALVLAVTVGVGVGSRPPISSAARAHQALDLQVFGGQASALPSTLLANL